MLVQTFAHAKKLAAFLVLAPLLIAGLSVFYSPAPVAAAPTLKSCKHFEGNYNMTKDADVKAFKAFQKDACSNKICSADPHQELDDKGHKFTVQTISCSNPSNNNNGATGITDPALTAGGCTGADCTIIDKYINPLIKLLSAAVGIIAVIAIIVGGIQISSANGDPQKVTNGRNHIRNAIIGLVAYVLLAVFLNWVVIGGIQ